MQCKKLTEERAEIRDELRMQLELFERREIQMEERKKQLLTERRRLWNTRANVTCRHCR
jgi:hypothetical protein